MVRWLGRPVLRNLQLDSPGAASLPAGHSERAGVVEVGRPFCGKPVWILWEVLLGCVKFALVVPMGSRCKAFLPDRRVEKGPRKNKNHKS